MSFDKHHAIIITGAAGGVGRATTEHLARALPDVHLALFDVDEDALDDLRNSLTPRAGQVLPAGVDVTDSASVDAAVAGTVTELGSITGLVTTAGVRMQSTDIVDVTDRQWQEILSINLFGTFTTVRATASQMIAAGSGGSIVTISSIGGTRARLGQSAYGASKAAVAQLTRTMALEFAAHGIHANSICPGLINTPMFQLAQQQDGEELTRARIFGMPERFRPGIPSRRIGQPDEIAGLIVYLLSPEARHITGQAIHIDGGESVI